MDRFSRGLLIAAMCLAVSVPGATGLQCLSCQYIKLGSSEKTVEAAFSSLISKSDDECQGSVSEATPGVTVQNCLSVIGLKAMCGKLDTTVYASASSTDVTIDVVSRGCVQEALGQTDACEEVDDGGKSGITSIFGSLATVSSVEGTSCRCSTDQCNGQQKVAVEKLCWVAGLLLAFCVHHLC